MDREPGTRTVEVLESAEALARAAADTIVRAAQEAIEARGRFTIALSGGETARAIYEELASAERARIVDWSRAEVYWGDERCVPPDDEKSNYGMARDVLLSRVSVREEAVHRMPGEMDPERGAEQYERLLRERFGLAHGPPTAPVFDINHMGMGEDGHTASLFPGVEAIDERERWVRPTFHEQGGLWRLTLTPPALNASRLVLITVTGAAKAEKARDALESDIAPRALPVRVIDPQMGALLWMLDEAAGGKLSPRS